MATLTIKQINDIKRIVSEKLRNTYCIRFQKTSYFSHIIKMLNRSNAHLITFELFENDNNIIYTIEDIDELEIRHDLKVIISVTEAVNEVLGIQCSISMTNDNRHYSHSVQSIITYMNYKRYVLSMRENDITGFSILNFTNHDDYSIVLPVAYYTEKARRKADSKIFNYSYNSIFHMADAYVAGMNNSMPFNTLRSNSVKILSNKLIGENINMSDKYLKKTGYSLVALLRNMGYNKKEMAEIMQTTTDIVDDISRKLMCEINAYNECDPTLEHFRYIMNRIYIKRAEARLTNNK